MFTLHNTFVMIFQSPFDILLYVTDYVTRIKPLVLFHIQSLVASTRLWADEL